MTKMLNSSAVYFMNNLYRSFKTIGLVGKPRNDINLQMHKKFVSLVNGTRLSSNDGKRCC